jgi:hypothetical protein
VVLVYELAAGAWERVIVERKDGVHPLLFCHPEQVHRQAAQVMKVYYIRSPRLQERAPRTKPV